MKYKPGDKVKVISSTWRPNSETREIIGSIVEVKEYVGDYVYVIHDGTIWSFNESDLSPVEKNLYNLKVGDIVIDGNLSERLIIDKISTLFVMSEVEDHEANIFMMNAYNLKKHGYKVKQPITESEYTELTLAEVAKLAGVDVSKLRIKENE